MKRIKSFLNIITLSIMTQTSAQIGDPIKLGPGPHLFIDDYLIAHQEFLSRTVNQPVKLPDPIVTGGKDGDRNFQPWLSVLQDESTGRFRMWYSIPESRQQTHLGYIESEDGVHWIRPYRVLADPDTIRFNISIIDRGVDYEKPDERFVFGYYYDGGLKVAVSPDGLEWRMLTKKTLVKHNQDCNSLQWDPIRKQFLFIGQMKLKIKPDWEEKRRIPHQSVSKDLLNWEPMWPVIMPKIGAPIEAGETQFYAMSGIIARGDLLIGLVKVLRDDLNATPGKTAKEMGDMDRKAAGIGYTVLAWSRDGRIWQRDHEVFLPNALHPEAWDHANAWGASQLVVGDEIFVYYVGYKRGHKVARYDERQIGLARMPLDRYVSREADLNAGTLITKPVIFDAEAMTINAKIIGSLRVRLLDVNRKPVTEFEWFDLSGNSVAHAVKWSAELKKLGQKPVHIEFQLQDAQLFGFNLYE